jgi:hypothetical protein
MLNLLGIDQRVVVRAWLLEIGRPRVDPSNSRERITVA